MTCSLCDGGNKVKVRFVSGEHILACRECAKKKKNIVVYAGIERVVVGRKHSRVYKVVFAA